MSSEKLVKTIEGVYKSSRSLKSGNSGLRPDYTATLAVAVAALANKGQAITPENIEKVIKKEKILKVKPGGRQERSGFRKLKTSSKKSHSKARSNRQLQKEVGGLVINPKKDTVRFNKPSPWTTWDMKKAIYRERKRVKEMKRFNKKVYEERLRKALLKEKAKMDAMTPEQRERYIKRKQFYRGAITALKEVDAFIADPIKYTCKAIDRGVLRCERYIADKTIGALGRLVRKGKDGLVSYVTGIETRERKVNEAVDFMMGMKQGIEDGYFHQFREAEKGIKELKKKYGITQSMINARIRLQEEKVEMERAEKEIKKVVEVAQARQEIVEAIQEVQPEVKKVEALNMVVNNEAPVKLKESLIVKADITKCTTCGRVILRTKFGSRGSQCHHGYSKASKGGK